MLTSIQAPCKQSLSFACSILAFSSSVKKKTKGGSARRVLFRYLTSKSFVSFSGTQWTIYFGTNREWLQTGMPRGCPSKCVPNNEKLLAIQVKLSLSLLLKLKLLLRRLGNYSRLPLNSYGRHKIFFERFS